MRGHQLPDNLYEILGLEDYATKIDIRRKYKALCLEHHPDRGGDEERMKQINAAYDILMRIKEEYDHALRRHRANQQQRVTVKFSYNFYGNTGGTWYEATDCGTGATDCGTGATGTTNW